MWPKVCCECPRCRNATWSFDQRRVNGLNCTWGNKYLFFFWSTLEVIVDSTKSVPDLHVMNFQNTYGELFLSSSSRLFREVERRKRTSCQTRKSNYCRRMIFRKKKKKWQLQPLCDRPNTPPPLPLASLARTYFVLFVNGLGKKKNGDEKKKNGWDR